MKSYLIVLLFSLVGSAVSASEEHHSIQVPINQMNLTCYSDSIHLAWKGIPGIWELKGEPGTYNGLWERRFGIEGERSCPKLPDLFEIAVNNGSTLNAHLIVLKYEATVCFGGAYDTPRYCEKRNFIEARLRLPLGITLYHIDY